MNWLDAVYIIILGLTAIIGLWRGLFSLVFAFVALLLGWIIGGALSVPLANALGGGPIAEIVCFTLLFLVFAALIYFILTRFVRPSIKLTPPGRINRVSGLVFGVAVGFGICGFIAWLLGIYVAWSFPGDIRVISSQVNSPEQAAYNALHSSILTPAVESYFSWIAALLPEKLRAVRDIFVTL